MGYEINSPVKQVWLPLDYEFIKDNTNTTFSVFSELYREKYGIDLHDIFTLNKNGNSYHISLNCDLVGSYNVGYLDDSIKTKLAENNAIRVLDDVSQSEIEDIVLLRVGIGNNNFGHGFDIKLPVSSVVINSVDDLIVVLFEI